jgi:hypothetical protein
VSLPRGRLRGWALRRFRRAIWHEDGYATEAVMLDDVRETK